MDSIMEKLNDAQREAVTSTEGFVRVIAGAGSGKTRALTYRFAYLVNELGIMPGNILCVTFTNKAAQEMRRRIHQLTGDNDTGFINTFHGFCVSVLDEEIHAVSYPKNFLVLDNSDINRMLKIIYEERELSLRDMSFSAARDMIEVQKLFKRPEYYLDLISLPIETLHRKYTEASNVKDIIFFGYLYQQKKCFGLDYNDLIKFTLYIFKENEEIRTRWQKRLEYIMIDEFQDIDFLQYELMEQLCAYHKNLFIVGDPDQTIYTWRGADVKYLLEFDKAFPKVKTILMNDNYRSTPQIISVCNSLISKNRFRIKKDLVSKNPPGEKPVFHHAKTLEEEALWIAESIKKLAESGAELSDVAVLYRAHYITRNIEDALLASEIPYKIYSGVQFFERAEIKDSLSYLRMLVYKDDLSFLRIVNVPRRNMGERRIKYLTEVSERDGISLYEALRRELDADIFKGTKAAAFVNLIESFESLSENMPVSELFSKIMDKSGYEAQLRTEGSQERLDNLAELKQSIYEFETSCGEEADLRGYLEHAALYSNSDEPDRSDCVRLMTVHAAKGLEFRYVFLCAMNEDVFPSKKISTLEEMEEERRLAFVAMTRAEEALFLSEADGRTLDGSPRYPSRFILDIDENLLLADNPMQPNRMEDARSYIAVKERNLPENLKDTMIPAGSRVKHSIFGEGTILDADANAKVYTIKFDILDTPRKLNLRVPLKKL